MPYPLYPEDTENVTVSVYVEVTLNIADWEQGRSDVGKPPLTRDYAAEALHEIMEGVDAHFSALGMDDAVDAVTFG